MVVVLDANGHACPDAYGAYIGPSVELMPEPGESWRDALAWETARGNALEDILAASGYEVAYCPTVERVAEYKDVENLTVNEEPWSLRGEGEQ